MRIGHLEIFVTDTSRSKQFYSDILGFEVTAEQPGGVVWLKLDETEVLLRSGKANGLSHRYGDASSALVLYTKDLSKAVSVLSRRGLEFSGDDGEGCPTFRDPDGHWFQLCNPGAF